MYEKEIKEWGERRDKKVFFEFHKKIETLKDCFEYLNSKYKIVRMITLKKPLIIQNPLLNSFSFVRCVLASDEMEEYEKKNIWIKRKKLKIKTANINTEIFCVFESITEKIPVFIIRSDKKNHEQFF